MKTVDPSSPSSHYVLIDSLSVLLRRHGLSAITELLDALPGAQLPGKNLLKTNFTIFMLQYFSYQYHLFLLLYGTSTTVVFA